MKTNTARKLWIAMIAGTVLAGSMAASAGSVDEQMSIRVSYADLDLDSSADQLRLEQRITRAARAICGSVISRGNAGSLRQALENQECRQRAKADALIASGLVRKDGRYAMID